MKAFIDITILTIAFLFANVHNALSVKTDRNIYKISSIYDLEGLYIDSAFNKKWDYQNEFGKFTFVGNYDTSTNTEIDSCGPEYINCSLERCASKFSNKNSWCEQNILTIPQTTFDDSVRIFADRNYKRLRSVNASQTANSNDSNAQNKPLRICKLGRNIFYNTDKIGQIKVPEGVNVIDGSFIGLKAEQIKLPNSIKTITEGSFRGCDNLREIKIGDDNKVFENRDGVLFKRADSINGIKESLLCCPNIVGLFKYTIPSTTYRICDYAFSGGNFIYELEIPESVKEIGWNAFENMWNLRYVNVYWEHPEDVLIDNLKQQKKEDLGKNILSGRYEIFTGDDYSPVVKMFHGLSKKYLNKDLIKRDDKTGYLDINKTNIYYSIPRTPFHYDISYNENILHIDHITDCYYHFSLLYTHETDCNSSGTQTIIPRKQDDICRYYYYYDKNFDYIKALKKKEITLIVPKGTKHKYKRLRPWESFKIIEREK